MAKVEDVIREQERVIKGIDRLIPNLKKLGKDNINSSVIKGRLELLQSYWKKCQELDDQINCSVPAKDRGAITYFATDVIAATENTYLNALTTLYEWEENLRLTAPCSSSSTKPPNTHEVNPVMSVRLPQIDIPKFTGSYLEWENFRDLFDSLIDQNGTLSNVQRFHYLKTSLQGEASLLLKNVTVTSSNYESAWSALKARYDNKRLLVTAHLHALSTVSPVTAKSGSELKRLLDQTNEAVSALRNLGRPVQHWDDWIVFSTTQKLDAVSREEWELSLGSRDDYPTFYELRTFLEGRARALEAINASSERQASGECKYSGNKVPCYRTTKVKAHHATASQKSCTLCQQPHQLTYCPRLRQKPIEQRLDVVKRQQCCFNCLRQGHMVNQCPSESRCRLCQRKHHTLLHSNAERTDPVEPPRSDSISTEPPPSPSKGKDPLQPTVAVHIARECAAEVKNTLLATARVKLRAANGRSINVRALLDQGSESSFVTESVVQMLRASRQKACVSVTGLGGQPSNTVRSSVSLRLEPCHGDTPSVPFKAYVLQKLTTYIPKRSANILNWHGIRELTLADPNHSDVSPIDMLLGADLYAIILRDGVNHSPTGELVAQNTIFGWVLSGTILEIARTSATAPQSVLHCTHSELLDNSLRRFWEVEELPEKRILSEEDQRCEEHFLSTHRRDENGRYIVRLPFTKDPPLDVGHSLGIATSSLQRLERRLLRNSAHAEMYDQFMQEYRRLGHMEPAPLKESTEASQVIYLPHHAVFRESSTTTRLRVVFNASSHTSNGKSLNDLMLAGPKLQIDLFEILLRWRQHPIVIAADAEKMFRQIQVHHDDVDYQRILWRPSPAQELQAFRLLTVTYGTKAAPYLSLRVLKQLALDEAERYPRASKILETDVYVDDVLTGASDITTARELRRELTQLLKAGGFNLRKWASNCPEALKDIPVEQRASSGMQQINEDDSLKILGLVWDPHEDTFRFKITTTGDEVRCTKRTLLATIAKLFDPLGWLTPVVVTAKILMQELWLRGLSWDEPLPEDLNSKWIEYCENLSLLRRVSIPRFLGRKDNTIACEIHGFADASARAYAAVVYIRVILDFNNAHVTLLAAKSKVSPVKQISIPRLELCAAQLLARLIESVQRTMTMQTVPVHAWTDSAVVLAWLRGHSSRWHTFVANRVADIQTRMPSARWHHVPTSDNPADCASRGITSQLLVEHSLWWTGPLWLKLHSTTWPQSGDQVEGVIDLEERGNRQVLHVNQTEPWDLPSRFSSWPKLLRVTAYCRRFGDLVRSFPPQRPSRALSAEEIEKARRFWLKFVQSAVFASELAALREGRELPRNSSLSSLNPFLDDSELLRIGGRLRHALLPFEERHPVVLPSHRISDLIIAHAHLRALHGGPQLTIRVLRQQYWILGCRNLVRSHIHRCTKCIRERAKLSTQQMADLPRTRAVPSRPFTHSGVDYAGPILVRNSKGRGHQAHKAYIALFVCFATRAIHLELVSDYSTASFLAAFQRFVSRRGIPVAIYSDNGTTFRGADAELQRTFRALMRDIDLASLLASDGTAWHFIPPAAPHFGGLWESGVKAMKHHLRRMIGSHTLTSEELNTLLTQVEACLNSRPLGPLNDDPKDLTALTPGHFLIGAPLKAVPEPSLLEINVNRLSRWQLVRQLLEQLWRRWSHEYLHSLQQRHKWRKPTREIKPNELVLINNELLPPSKWLLGRIIRCHPGADGKTRVVTIRTANTTLQRPITKICPLLIRGPDDEDIPGS